MRLYILYIHTHTQSSQIITVTFLKCLDDFKELFYVFTKFGKLALPIFHAK